MSGTPRLPGLGTPGQCQGRGWVASRQDGAQVPACSPFPGQGNGHARQILSARCAPQPPRPLLPGAPVNKLYNGHHGCLQNHGWLLGSAQVEAMSWTTQWVPSAACDLLPQGDAQNHGRAGLCPPPQCPGSCSHLRWAFGGEGSPPSEHTCVCKAPSGVNMVVCAQTCCTSSSQPCQHTHTEPVPWSPLSPARARPAGSSCSVSSPTQALAAQRTAPCLLPALPSHHSNKGL